MPRLEVNRRSARRWRRMMSAAFCRPRGVNSTTECPSEEAWATRMGDQQPEFGHFFDGNGDRQQTVDLHAAHFRLLAMLLNDPDFLQHLIKLLVVGHGEDFLCGDAAVMNIHAAVSH